MAKTTKKFPEVTYSGKKRKLDFSLLSMIKYEELTGENFTSIVAGEETEGTSMTTVANMLLCGLLGEFPELTLETVAAEFDLTDLEEIGNAIAVAFNKHE